MFAKPLPRKEFIFASLDRARWTKRQAEPFCCERCDIRGPIANGGDSIEGSARDDLVDPVDGFIGRVEAQRDGVVSPWVV
jgi:hypothetical protein